MMNSVAEIVVSCVSRELAWLAGCLHVLDIQADTSDECSVHIILVHFIEDV